ncbi:hypothetical protein, conserved [Babesia ovata]|uniref:Uncharacterized protein n=1 Tax=Babesia ovata TaxID=189622 RepID=A0A2H6KH32_9APIC|nr:uncharacterized protein BOVATA_037950 [Babesia ovata]GBE62302.1 hypothetical protein, conserved [Babesia ovata]
MVFHSYVRRIFSQVIPAYRGVPVFQNGFVRYTAAAARTDPSALEPVRPDDSSITPSREAVLRVSKDGVDFVEGAVSGSLVTELEDEMLPSAPHIDKNSFKNYIEIPNSGIRSLLSASSLRILTNCPIPFKEYVEGSPNAHHYPLSILPRKFSAKLGGDVMVTTYDVHEKDYNVENGRRVMLSVFPTLRTQPSEVLLQKLQGKNTLLVLFSGDPPYADAKNALEWHSAVEFDVHKHLILNYASPVGMWHFHKRYVTTLASSLVNRCNFSCIMRKLSAEETVAFHQYRRSFTSVLLLDRFGYIRWHAVGKPTLEARYLLKEAYDQLQSEC